MNKNSVSLTRTPMEEKGKEGEKTQVGKWKIDSGNQKNTLIKLYL